MSRESNSAKKNLDLFLVPRAARQAGQLGDVRSNAASFVVSEQIGSRATAGLRHSCSASRFTAGAAGFLILSFNERAIKLTA